MREQIKNGQLSGSRDNVVRGLCHVDVIIRVNNRIISLCAAKKLNSTVCDDFVCVHVGARSGTALDSVNDEFFF